MGCGSCKSSKATVPLASNIEDTLVQQTVSFLNNPNQSVQILSDSKRYDTAQVDQIVSGSSINMRTDRSDKSVEALTASKEFVRLVQNSMDYSGQTQKEYKIYVWTQNRKNLRAVFPERSYHEVLIQNSERVEVNFTIYTSSTPIIIDCIVYMIEKPEDFKEIFKINQEFKHVWVQALFSLTNDKKISEISETLGIQILKSSQDLFKKIFSEDLKLISMLKSLFNQIDDNKNGEIDFNELINGFRCIKEDITLEELREGLKRIDVDKDGKISFEEFCFWWKKGRQGPLCFAETALNWAKKITISNPETRMMLRKILQNRAVIEKGMRKKEILVKVGKEFLPQTRAEVQIGKSATREKILNDLNSKLGLFCQEVWVCIKLALRDGVGDGFGNEIKKQAEALIENISGSFIDGRKLKDAIEVEIKIIGLEFYLTFILDIENEFMESLNTLLLKLDELLTSPTNDFITFKFSSIEPFYKFFKKENDLFSNLGTDYQASILVSHWNKYISVLSTSFTSFLNSYPIIASCSIGDSKLEFNFKDSNNLLKSFPSLVSRFSNLSDWLTPGFLHFLEYLMPFVRNDLSLYSRCSNLGISLKLNSPDILSKLLQNS